MLNRDLGAEKISSEIAFSSVDTIVILSHGNMPHIDFGGNDNAEDAVELYDIYVNANLANNKWPCRVNILDVQACYCGRMFDDDEFGPDTCIAKAFSELTSINKVYAWSGKCEFHATRNFPLGYNTSIDGQYTLYRNGNKIEEYGNRVLPYQYE